GDENLYKVTESGGAYFPSSFVHNGKLRIDIQPWDLGGKSGNIQTVTFTLDQTIPRLENPLIEVNGVDKLAWDYLYVRGTIVLKATASDNSAVISIKLSLDNGETYGGELIGTYTTGTPDAYLLEKPINTLTDPQIPSAILSEKNGPLSMVVKLQDDALHFNNWLVTLNLDNKYPNKNLYTGLSEGHDPMDLHGDVGDDYSQVMGTCADTGSVSGIDKVEVYLVRGANVIDLTTGGLVAKESAPFGESQTSEDYTTDPDCKLVIDWATYPNMDLNQVGSDVKWWAKLDTLLIPDGNLEIHYVAWDKAGNAVHGEQAGFIKNHAPDIETVTVGTDLDDNGTVDGDEKITYEP
ncbi:MAG TPA: hypothetical protein VJ553_05890, partial [Candidatus Paceibacterota bacterium]|nr:hypothetical protein [Candidatus Paceibacterota bacterium]